MFHQCKGPASVVFRDVFDDSREAGWLESGWTAVIISGLWLGSH